MKDGLASDLLQKADLTALLFPSDNVLGIPTLLPEMQAPGVVAPVSCWGARLGRTKLTRLGGTVVFYTEDYRFAALLKDPSPVAKGTFAAAVEPNISVYTGCSPAEAIWATYQKRYTARWWQEHGVRVLVDMNVAPEYLELNLLGVPKGWTAYATRGYTDRLAHTEREYQTALAHSGESRIVFFVYGGGRKVREAAIEYGWIWHPEEVDVQKGRANALAGPVEQVSLPSAIPGLPATTDSGPEETETV